MRSQRADILNVSGNDAAILDQICEVFALSPRPQWWETLRICFLPQVPMKMPTLLETTTWRETEEAFEQGLISQIEIYRAGWLLLLDTWLYAHGFHDQLENSRFNHLAEITKDLDEPPLRIAHCIRDLAYGDESRIDDLVAMVRSDDPAYRQIFESCLWLPTPEEEAEAE